MKYKGLMKLLYSFILGFVLLGQKPHIHKPVPPVPTVEVLDPDCIKDGDGYWFMAADGSFAYGATCYAAHRHANSLPAPVHRNDVNHEGKPVILGQA